jgi:hypothetical protein
VAILNKQQVLISAGVQNACFKGDSLALRRDCIVDGMQ